MKKLFKFVCLVLGIIIGVVVYNGYQMYKNAIDEVPLSQMVENIRANPQFTTIDKLPQMYIDAVVAVEDKRFFEHNGIDLISIGRAVINDIKAKRFVEGGSTITQQLAKNTYFTQEKKITRKIAEIFMAFEIEKNYSKDEIFELYVNTSYFGDGYYCVKAASIGYFDKEPIKMTDYESTLLAGIPNAPSVYAPTKNPDLAHQRQRQVLNKLVECGYLTETEVTQVISQY